MNFTRDFWRRVYRRRYLAESQRIEFERVRLDYRRLIVSLNSLVASDCTVRTMSLYQSVSGPMRFVVPAGTEVVITLEGCE